MNSRNTENPPDALQRYVAGEPLRIGNQWRFLMDDTVSEDGTRIEVNWRGNSDGSALRGRPVFLRFQLRNKGLCAFRIAQGTERAT